MSEHKTNPLLRWRHAEQVRATDACDRFGRPLQPGDMVFVKGSDILWEVQAVTPDMTPRNVPPQPGVPRNVQPVILSLVAVCVLTIAGGMPTTEIVKVRDLGERDAETQQRFVEPTGAPS